ncbi:MAG: hypothetical protein QNJ40_24480 [Xanthomonadales bacterium]|nr:hypothetical protein [Xanthomonadales bacterium]
MSDQAMVSIFAICLIRLRVLARAHEEALELANQTVSELPRS